MHYFTSYSTHLTHDPKNRVKTLCLVLEVLVRAGVLVSAGAWG